VKNKPNATINFQRCGFMTERLSNRSSSPTY
jgi:hypothetical protein